MSVAFGDIVTLSIIEVSGYACWSELDGQIGFTHCVDWSLEKTVPEKYYPKVGQKLRAKVFYITESSDEPLPADVTFDGKFRVDFAASFALLQPKPTNESV